MNTNNDTNHNQSTNKKDKALAVLLCIGVFAGLVYLNHLSRNKAEEFSKEVEHNILLMSTGENRKLQGQLDILTENYVRDSIIRWLPSDLKARLDTARWVKLILKRKPETCKNFISFSIRNFDKYSNSNKKLLLEACDDPYWGHFYFN